jgi:hypothetical protein
MKKIFISEFEYRNLEEFAVTFGGTRKVPYFAIYVLDSEDGKEIVVSRVDEVDAMGWRKMKASEYEAEVILPDGRRKAFLLPQGNEITTIGEYR